MHCKKTDRFLPVRRDGFRAWNMRMPGLRHRRPEGNEESVPSAYPVREFLCEMLRLRLSMTVGWQTMLSMQLDRVLLSQRRRICAQAIEVGSVE